MLEACVLAAAVSVDTFLAAMGCRMNGIRIPKRCALLVSVVSTAVMAASLLAGRALAAVLPEGLCRYGGAALLGAMGLLSLLKEGLGALMRRKRRVRRHALGLVIEICMDESAADRDHSKTLSLAEAPAYAAAMSLDALGSGLGAGLRGGEIVVCLAAMLLLGFGLTVLGNRVGRAGRWNWVGGVLLLGLGLLRLL